MFGLFGWSTLSLQQVSYFSNEPTLDKSAFLMTIQQTGQGESAQGTISAGNIADSDRTATKDLSITSKIEDYRCEYQLEKISDYVYHYSIVDTCGKLNPLCSFDFEDRCYDRGTDHYYDLTAGQMLCIRKTIDATIGNVKDAKFNFKTTFTIDVEDSAPVSLMLTPQDTSAISPDRNVNIAWTGNTVSGTDCPSPAVNKISTVRYNNAWRLVDSDVLTNYRLSHKIQLDDCIAAVDWAGDEHVCISEVNAKVQSALNTKPFSFGNDIADTYTYEGNIDAGVAMIELSQLLQYPGYTLIVSADTLGVAKPVGMPEILDATSDLEFTTGNFGYIDVALKNVGEALGSFSVDADCQGAVSYIGTAQYISLMPDESGLVKLQVQGESNSKTSDACLITALDRNYPTNKDTKIVYVTVNPTLICTVGELRCVGERDEKCIGGTHWSEVIGSDRCRDDDDGSACNIDADCDDGKFLTLDRCQGKIVLGVDTGIDKQCTHKDMTWYLIGMIFVGFIAVIFVMMMAMGMILKRK